MDNKVEDQMNEGEGACPEPHSPVMEGGGDGKKLNIQPLLCIGPTIRIG